MGHIGPIWEIRLWFANNFKKNKINQLNLKHCNFGLYLVSSKRHHFVYVIVRMHNIYNF